MRSSLNVGHCLIEIGECSDCESGGPDSRRSHEPESIRDLVDCLFVVTGAALNISPEVANLSARRPGALR